MVFWNRTTRDQIHRLVDALPDDALDAARRMLAGLSAPSVADPVTSALAKAPMDDEAVTRGDAQAIAEGERDVEEGRVSPQWSFGHVSVCDRPLCQSGRLVSA